MLLQPCSSVAACRKQALPQLAFVGGTPTAQQHSLVVQNGTVVPFPVGKGIATAVMAVDGRTNTLRGDPKYKTPKVCREAKRDCWSCLPSNCHFIVVTMPNAPGMLSLGGADNGGSENWLLAYRRWGQALASWNIFAVQSSVNALAEAVVTWLGDAVDAVPADVLRGFWGSYLGDAMRSRGFDVNVPEALGDLSRNAPNFDWIAAAVAEPVCREGSYDNIERLIYQGYDSVTPFMVSVNLRQNGNYTESITIRSYGDLVEFHFVSETWWKHEGVVSVELASSIATSLMLLVTNALDRAPPVADFKVPLREVAAQVGEHRIRLGWESKPMSWDSLLLMEYLHWHYYKMRQTWPLLLMIGDPRVRLCVMPDGRANLKIDRSLLRRD